jgi:hypothetical protein
MWLSYLDIIVPASVPFMAARAGGTGRDVLALLSLVESHLLQLFESIPLQLSIFLAQMLLYHYVICCIIGGLDLEQSPICFHFPPSVISYYLFHEHCVKSGKNLAVLGEVVAAPDLYQKFVEFVYVPYHNSFGIATS